MLPALDRMSLVLQRDPVRSGPGPGNLNLTASERKDFLGVLVVEGHPGSGARGSGQRNRRTRSLRRAHDQLLGPRVSLAHGSHKANPLIFGTRSVEDNRAESRFHRHPPPLVKSSLVTVVDQSRRRTRSLDAYVPASRVNLSVIGRGRPKLNSGLSVRGAVSGRNNPSVIASSDRDLSPARIIVSGSTVCRVDHALSSPRTTGPPELLSLSDQKLRPHCWSETPIRDRLNLPRPLDQSVRSAQTRTHVLPKSQVSSVKSNRAGYRYRGVGRHAGRVRTLSDTQTRDSRPKIEVLVIERRGEGGRMRFHHHTTRSVRSVGETAAQSLIVQYAPTQSQSGASVSHRSARATSETRRPGHNTIPSVPP